MSDLPVSARFCVDRDGAMYLPALAAPLLDELCRFADALPQQHAGIRLRAIPAELRELVASTWPGWTAVRAILFDKSHDSNWSLGWHRDRTIAVARRHDVAGYGPWTRKRGIDHVAPPFALLAAMRTLRLHLDPVDGDNAPLLVALGSHRLVDVADNEASVIAARHAVLACRADAGDAWLYATSILHASAAAAKPRRRRVLQLDLARTALPDGLDWLGVVAAPPLETPAALH